MAGRTGDAETEKTGIGEVEVDGVDGVNVTVFIEEVLGASGVDTSVRTSNSVGRGVADEGAGDL